MNDDRPNPHAEDDRPYVLAVDDEEANRDLFVRLFDDELRLLTAASGAEALELLAANEVGVLLTDHRMPNMSGVDLLAVVAERWPDVRRVLVTAYSDRDLLLDAIRRGHVEEFVTKPWEPDALRLRVEAGLSSYLRASDRARATTERASLRREVEGYAGGVLVGLDGGLAAVGSAIEKVGKTRTPVVVQGEIGTGKELVARTIHHASARAAGPFVRIACRTAKVLDAEAAASGTLFLDDVASLDDSAQSALMELLEDPRVRVIAATADPLDERVRERRFREDLFFRLAVLPIHLPPLRERREDIGALARHFVAMFADAMGKDLSVTPRAVATLQTYDWPGNVRELRNVIERACVLADPATALEPDDLTFDFAGPAAGAAAASIFAEISAEEGARIREALRNAGGNRARAARALGIPRTTLGDRMRKLGIV